MSKKNTTVYDANVKCHFEFVFGNRKIVGDVVNVNKEVAEYLLQFNTHNRPCSREDILRLADMMSNNEWKKATLNFIQFSEAGQLIDGQTRLHAVALSNTSWEFIILHNVSKSASDAIDCGRLRSIFHRLMLSDNNDSSAKYLGPLLNIAINKKSLDSVKKLLEMYGEITHFAENLSKGHRKGMGQGKAIIWASIARGLLFGEKRERLEHFAEVIKTGIAYDEGDRAAIELRDILVKKSAAGGGGQESIRKDVFNAMYSFCNHQQVKKLTPCPERYCRFDWE